MRDYKCRFDGEAEAPLIALAFSEAPEGQERWTLRLLKKHLIQLGVVDNCSPETVWTTLNKMELNLG